VIALWDDPRVGELVDSKRECVVWGVRVDANGGLWAVIGEVVEAGWHGATLRTVPANEVVVYSGRRTL